MIKTVIIDDENSCIEALSLLLKEHCPHIRILGSGSSVEDGIKLIRELQPELVFLDIELKNELSFAILDQIQPINFHVIFSTAHEKYAVRAIKASCLEYLLKPINTSELVEAIRKFEKNKQQNFNQKKIEFLLENMNQSNARINKIAIPSPNGYAFVNSNDIMYCEADLKYTEIYTVHNERIISSKNLGEFEDLLPKQAFFRCHKSFIVNLDFVKNFIKNENHVILSNDKIIDVSLRKKDEFLKLFERF